MSASQDQTSAFNEAGARPHVDVYVQPPEFHVGDKVYLLNSNGTREGPYLIASVPSVGKVTLCLENTGQAVKNDEAIDVDYVEVA